MFDHKKVCQGVTAEYGVTMLVWFEAIEDRENAFRRERRIKQWKRAWKLRLIEETNPDWRDPYEDISNLVG